MVWIGVYQQILKLTRALHILQEIDFSMFKLQLELLIFHVREHDLRLILKYLYCVLKLFLVAFCIL